MDADLASSDPELQSIPATPEYQSDLLLQSMSLTASSRKSSAPLLAHSGLWGGDDNISVMALICSSVAPASASFLAPVQHAIIRQPGFFDYVGKPGAEVDRVECLAL